MQQPNTFASEQIKQDYISSLQNYALGQIEQQVSLQDKTSLKVALLSYVAVLPQYSDKSFIDKSLKLDLDSANFNELLGKIITSNFKIANIAQTRAEEFLTRGMASIQMLDIVFSNAFRENCAKFNFNPKFVQEKNVVERVVAGLMDIYSNGQLVFDLMFDKREFLDKLEDRDSTLAKLNFKFNLLLNNFKNTNKNDYAKALCTLSLINFCLADLADKKLTQNEIISVHNYINDFDIFIKNTAKELLAQERIKDVETLYDRKVAFDNLIDKLNKNNAIDFSDVEQILKQAKIEKITSATGKMHKQLEVLEQGKALENSVANYTYLHILANYSNYCFAQEFLVNAIEKLQGKNNLSIDNCLQSAHTTALEMQDDEIVKAVECLQENGNIAKSSGLPANCIFENYFDNLADNLTTLHRSKLYYRTEQPHIRKTPTRLNSIAFLGLSEGIEIVEPIQKESIEDNKIAKTENEENSPNETAEVIEEKPIESLEEEPADSQPEDTKSKPISNRFSLGLTSEQYSEAKQLLKDYKEKQQDENLYTTITQQNSMLDTQSDMQQNDIPQLQTNQPQEQSELGVGEQEEENDLDDLKQIFAQVREQAKQKLDNLPQQFDNNETLQPIEDLQVDLVEYYQPTPNPFVQNAQNYNVNASNSQLNDENTQYSYQNHDTYEYPYYQEQQEFNTNNQTEQQDYYNNYVDTQNNYQYSNTSNEYNQYPEYSEQYQDYNGQGYDQQYYSQEAGQTDYDQNYESGNEYYNQYQDYGEQNLDYNSNDSQYYNDEYYSNYEPYQSQTQEEQNLNKDNLYTDLNNSNFYTNYNQDEYLAEQQTGNSQEIHIGGLEGAQYPQNDVENRINNFNLQQNEDKKNY